MQSTKLKLANFLLLLFLVCFGVVALGQPFFALKRSEIAPITAQVEQSVVQTAKHVTVRILTNPGGGSGVVINRQGQTYTVLTCAHVVELGRDHTVLTSDGKMHKASRKLMPKLNGVDLALVQFQSRIPYQVAVLNRFKSVKEIAVDLPAYASGFANYQEVGINAVENTLDWGLRAYRFTTGRVTMLLLDQILEGGYQLGYTNDVQLGMSGGPVLDQRGRLIGINGWLKYPLQGSDVFQFVDGKLPSQALFKRMEALSWAIPISTFWQRIEQFPISANSF